MLGCPEEHLVSANGNDTLASHLFRRNSEFDDPCEVVRIPPCRRSNEPDGKVYHSRPGLSCRVVFRNAGFGQCPELWVRPKYDDSNHNQISIVSAEE